MKSLREAITNDYEEYTELCEKLKVKPKDILEDDPTFYSHWEKIKKIHKVKEK